MREAPIDPALPILDELGEALCEGARVVERGRSTRRRFARDGEPHRGAHAARVPLSSSTSRAMSVLTWLLRRPLLALVLPVALGGGVALAATGVLRSGSSVPVAAHLTPDARLGVPVPGQTRLIAKSAPDPAGGPPWSMRIVRTTRDDVCIQIARLYGRQLGVIGEDGSFDDDKRFHPVPPDAISQVPQRFVSICEPAGEATSQELSGVLASGEATGARTLGKPSEERRLDFGLLGPAAVSVTYRLHGGPVTLPVEPGSGAYLIVLPGATPAPGVLGGGGTTGEGPFVPAGALTEITYRRGRGLCVERAIGAPRGPDPCPHRTALLPTAKPRDLHWPIHVTLRAVHGYLPVPVRLRDGRPLPPPARPRVGIEYEATVSFRAPFTVRSALSGYSLAVPSHCRGGGVEETALEWNIRAGELVHARSHVFPRPCARSATIDVNYRPSAVGARFDPREETLVGRDTVRLP